MSTNKVETRLREIAEREKKATKGPWESEQNRDWCEWRVVNNSEEGCRPIISSTEQPERDYFDAEFIAHSRQDVPWLLALIKKQREALEADALADKLFERAEAHREESIACGYDNDPTGSLAVTESYKAANAQALIATQLKRDALNFSPENL